MITITTADRPRGKRRWRRVRMAEIRQVQENLRARGIWYNGCTGHEMTLIYGSANLKHIAGQGWYKLTTNPAI